MNIFSILIDDYSDDFSINDNITIDRDRDQVARNSHVEHANESSEFSYHFRRLFVETSVFFFTRYVVFSFLQRSHSIDVTFVQFSKSVFDQSISLNSHSNSWLQSQQKRKNSEILQQVTMKQRVTKLEENMNSLIVSIDFMKIEMRSFHRNLNDFFQQKFIERFIQNQINSFISLEYNAAHSEYNRNHTMSSNDSKKHLAIDFKTSNIDFFVSSLIITFEYFANDVINVSKYIIYRDVILFVQQIRCIIRINFENIVSRLHECFRDFAMQWYSNLMMKLQNKISRIVKIFCTRFEQKYKMFTSQTFDKLIFEHYTMSNAQKLRFVNEYIQIIFRYSRAIELSEFAVLTIVWKNFDFELQRDVRVFESNDDQDDFIKRLKQICELWINKNRQSIAEREETTYQRNLKINVRQQQQLIEYQQQKYQQQEYSQQSDQNRQQYQRFFRFERNQVMSSSQQYIIPINATSIFDFVREYNIFSIYVFVNDQKLLINIVEIVEIDENETQSQTVNFYFVNEKADFVEMFFNDFVFQQKAQSSFSCMKCVRRWNIYDDLWKHMIQQHQIDSDSSSYSNQMHHVVVYSSIARDYIIVHAQFPDDVKREICLDTKSMMILTDDRIANKLSLEIKNIKSINLRDVENQLISKYVNYDIIIDNEKLIVQSYVVEKLDANVLLDMNIIKNYNVDILTFKNRICIENSEISMTYGRIGKVIVNHAVIKNIEQNIIQNDFVPNQVFRDHDHQGTDETQRIDQSGAMHFKECEKHEFEEFQSMYDSETRLAPVEQYVGRQTSKTSIFLHTCRRCFRTFRSNNELHEHLRCTHLKHRHRRRSAERTLPAQPNRRLDQPWRKLWPEISDHLSYKMSTISGRAQFTKTSESMNGELDEFLTSLRVLLIDFPAMRSTSPLLQMAWLRKRSFFFFFVNICYEFYAYRA